MDLKTKSLTIFCIDLKGSCLDIILNSSNLSKKSIKIIINISMEKMDKLMSDLFGGDHSMIDARLSSFRSTSKKIQN